MDGPDQQIVAGTTVARRGRAVLIRGAPGSGKSDLALRALTMPLVLPGEVHAGTFELISDDQTVIARKGGRLIARAPATISRRIEVRGAGVLDWPAIDSAQLTLVVDAVSHASERLPEAHSMRTQLMGVTLARIELSALETSALVKMALAVGGYTGSDTGV